MKVKRKICVITGTRAEYGLLYPLMKQIKKDSELELQIIATCMHLSPQYGSTWRNIVDDGFEINQKVEMLLSSDSDQAIAKSISLGVAGFCDAYINLNPDIVVILGDRFEALAAATAALPLRLSIAHIHGGELTEGSYDNTIRHAITKFSDLHFCAANAYKNRIIQMGEQPDRVYNVGAMAIDNIKSLQFMSKEKLEESIGFKFAKKNLLVSYQSPTLDSSLLKSQLNNLFTALETLNDTYLIFTMPNADANSHIIFEMISEFTAKNQHFSKACLNLGFKRYLSMMQFVDGVVGNSSSGIIEAPSFKIGTINIGNRQSGRIKAKSIIDCSPDKDSIIRAINKLYSNSFQREVKDIISPFGEGGASKKITDVLKFVDLASIKLKHFYDISIDALKNKEIVYEF